MYGLERAQIHHLPGHRHVLVLPVNPWTTIMIDTALGMSMMVEPEDCGTCRNAASCPHYDSKIVTLVGLQ